MNRRERLWHWLKSTRPPDPWPEGAEACPRCGRPIAGSYAPFGGMGGITPARWPLSTPHELIRLCPIDAPVGSAHRPGTRSVQEFRNAAHQIERQLHAQGDTSWARQFAEDLARPRDEFLAYLGHSSAFLVRRGPVLERGFSRDELEQLLVDTVATWPRRKQYPTIWARWRGGAS